MKSRFFETIIRFLNLANFVKVSWKCDHLGFETKMKGDFTIIQITPILKNKYLIAYVDLYYINFVGHYQ